MKSLLLATLLPLTLFAAKPAAVPIWDKTPPGETPTLPAGSPATGRMLDDDHISDIASPTLTWFRPEKPDGRAVIICPGGGYQKLSSVKEGVRVAERLTKLGVTAAVLHYRAPVKQTERADAAPRHDFAQALAVVRADMKSQGFANARVGAMGFSAGGHLVLEAGYGDMPTGAGRPDFVVAVYPAYLTEKNGALKAEFKPTKNSPPACFIHAANDPYPAEGSMLFWQRLRKEKVPAELHIYETGGHGYGISPRIAHLPIAKWPEAVEAWLNQSVPAPKR